MNHWFKDSLVCIENSRPTRVTFRPCLKETKKKVIILAFSPWLCLDSALAGSLVAGGRRKGKAGKRTEQGGEHLDHTVQTGTELVWDSLLCTKSYMIASDGNGYTAYDINLY